ncbi:MAG: cysteine desulfurase-like protein [Trueperaceae bacterium]|nr:cysteine desulfurase-like protein [Trueperaceae bacterium]
MPTPHQSTSDHPTTPDLPVAFAREQFPALSAGETVFLDNAAGAQVPKQVVANMVEALTTMQVNKGGAYAASRRITEAKERVRAQIAEFLNAPGADNIAFGPNATTLVELLAQAVGRGLEPGDEIIVTGMDHHANLDPWRRLEERGAVLKTWTPQGEHTTLEMEGLEPLLSEKTRVVAMTAASNALGTLNDVAAVADRVHALGAKLMVDSVHYAPHYLPDVQALGADMLVFSPYKVFGPHLGVLYLSDAARDAFTGPGLSFFGPEATINWEPGTQNHEAIYAFGGTFDYLNEVASEMGIAARGRDAWAEVFAAFARHEQTLCGRLLQGLDDRGITRYGLPGVDGRTATVSINVGDRSPDEVAKHLAKHDIAVASGHYYAYELIMAHVGLAERGGAVRISLLHYNDASDLDRLFAALDELI